jgi:chromosomal replication initiator protein
MAKQALDKDEIWKVALAQIEVKIDSPTHFRTWFTGTKLLEVDAGKALVGVRNSYTADWLRRKHQDMIESTLSYVFGDKLKVDYKIAEELANIPTPTVRAKDKVATNPSLLELSGGNSGELYSALTRYKINPKYSFENLVVGSSNQMAAAAAKAVAENPGQTYNPFFIYGRTGLGKTHLAHAISRRLLERNPDNRILYVPAETFLNEMVNAIKTGRTKNFRERYRDSLELLIIDDIQFISDWERTQTEFFNTFNVLQAANKQIIIISDRSPDELEKLTPRLRSRFQGGMVVDVSRPDFEHRLAILDRKLTSLGSAKVARDTLQFIAKNVTDNVRELEGALQKVALMQSLTPDRDLTIEEVAKQLGKDSISKRKKISVQQVLKIVARSFEVSVADIKGERRTKEVALARQACMYVLREELNYKLEEIAKLLNRKDHTTIMHGIDKMRSLRVVDEGFRQQLVNIVETLSSE